MKREIKANKPTEIKQPKYQKSTERQFAEAMDYMITQITKRFDNQVFGELNKSTIDKFEDAHKDEVFKFLIPYEVKKTKQLVKDTYYDKDGTIIDDYEIEHYDFFDKEYTTKKVPYDEDYYVTEYKEENLTNLQYLEKFNFRDAQVGNYASVFLGLTKKAKRKIMKQFDDDRIEDMVKNLLSKDNKKASVELYSAVEKKIGINAVSLMTSEGLSANMNALISETSQWAKKLRDETISNYTNNTLRDMAEGKSLDTIMEQFKGMEEKRKNHAKMVARTQISTFNSLSSKIRAQNLGITKGIWVTAKDERVRGNPSGKYPNAKPSHFWADGREFDLKEGLKFPDGVYRFPGVSYMCRCSTRYVIPGEEDEDI